MTKVGLTRKKACLIAVLATVLAFVLLRQPADPEPVSADANTAMGASAASTPSRKEPTESPSISPTANWPDIAIEETLANNPFASLAFVPISATEDKLPPPVADAAHATSPVSAGESPVDHEAAKQDALAEFQRLGVSMILKNKSKTCAVVGGQVVHEGDIIHGVRIVTITSREVIVEPVNEN